MRPPSLRFLTDSCVVHAPPTSAYDSEGAESLEDGAAADARPCLMDAQSAAGQPFLRQGEAVPHGMSRRVLHFRTDPGVSVADQKLVVTTVGGGVFTLRSLGPAEPPYGIQNCWNVAADLRV